MPPVKRSVDDKVKSPQDSSSSIETNRDRNRTSFNFGSNDNSDNNNNTPIFSSSYSTEAEESSDDMTKKKQKTAKYTELANEVHYTEIKNALATANTKAKLLMAIEENPSEFFAAGTLTLEGRMAIEGRLSEITATISTLNENLFKMDNALKIINSRNKGFGSHLEKTIAPLMLEAKNQLQQLKEIEALCSFYLTLFAKIAELNEFYNELGTFLDTCNAKDWSAPHSISDNDLEKIRKLATYKKKLASFRQELRNLSLMGRNISYCKNNMAFNQLFLKLVGTLPKNIDDKRLMIEKSSDLLHPIMRYENLVKCLEHAEKGSSTYDFLEKKLIAERESLIDEKNSIVPKPSAPVSTPLITSGLFAKIKATEHKAPVTTTWEYGWDTVMQAEFLDNFFANKEIARRIHALKHKDFNISFLEYVQDGEYKILFAISGSNDALSDISQFYYVDGGLNAVVVEFVREWNKRNPGVIFQYVESYNGNNLSMDDNGWYCSEPKLAIEYSKIVKNNVGKSHFRAGQNNWSINPDTLGRKEQSACTRQCQPHQNDMLQYTPAPSSPIRVTNG